MRRDVVIIGAGLSGATLAAILGRCGRDVLVLDDREAIDHQLGEHVQEITLRALSVIWPEALDVPYLCPWRDATLDNLHLGYTLRNRFAGIGAERNYLVNREAFDEGFLGAASAHCEIQLRTRVTELAAEHGRIRGVRARRSDGTTIEVEAPLTVIAGGARSRPLTRRWMRQEVLPLEVAHPRQGRRAIYEVTPDRPGALAVGSLFLCSDHQEGVDLVLIAGRQDPSTSLFYLMTRRSAGTRGRKLGGDLAARAREMFRGAVAERVINDLLLGNIVDDRASARFSLATRSPPPPGLLAIGSAAGYSEPLPGHGITFSVADAIRIADLLLTLEPGRDLPTATVDRWFERKMRVVETDLARADREWDAMVHMPRTLASFGAKGVGRWLGWLPMLRQWELGPLELAWLQRLWRRGAVGGWMRRLRR